MSAVMAVMLQWLFCITLYFFPSFFYFILISFPGNSSILPYITVMNVLFGNYVESAIKYYKSNSDHSLYVPYKMRLLSPLTSAQKNKSCRVCVCVCVHVSVINSSYPAVCELNQSFHFPTSFFIISCS